MRQVEAVQSLGLGLGPAGNVNKGRNLQAGTIPVSQCSLCVINIITVIMHIVIVFSCTINLETISSVRLHLQLADWR